MAGIYRVIGVMSGTSLDGLDIGFFRFERQDDGWHYEIEKVVTTTYPDELISRLSQPDLPAPNLAQLDFDLGHYIGEQVKQQITGDKPLLIASHGHTWFHQPEKGFTLQIGQGGAIAATSGLPVVCDFRSTDVAYGGQGAPLVPIGDELLFADYDACINLGGFANISYRSGEQRVAYDICAVNTVLNKYARELGQDYDAAGAFARSSIPNENVLGHLNDLSYYKQPFPKSLGIEWVQSDAIPLIEGALLTPEEALSTWTDHAAGQIAQVVKGRCLFTGGGTKNDFLLELIAARASGEVIVPEEQLIDYKEALIFGFLGLLRWLEEPNVLPSATGASKAAIGGAIYLP